MKKHLTLLKIYIEYFILQLRHNLFLKFDEKNKMIYSLQKAAIEAVKSKREYSNIIHCCEVATGLYSDLHKTKVSLYLGLFYL